jgi:hypothetical protein
MRYMYNLHKVPVDADNIKKETFVLQKIIRYSLFSVELTQKINAYHRLIDNNFNLPLEDEAWKFIDENPEFYEDIRGKILQ